MQCCRQRWAGFEVRVSSKVRSGWQGRELVVFGVSPRVEILQLLWAAITDSQWK